MGDLVSQRRLSNYTCARCGRAWRFTRLSLFITVLIALLPILYSLFPGLSADWRQLAQAGGLSLALYALGLLLWGRLGPSTASRR